MSLFFTLLIVIPLFYYAVLFWARVLRFGLLRLARLAAEHQPREADGGDYPWNDPNGPFSPPGARPRPDSRNG